MQRAARALRGKYTAKKVRREKVRHETTRTRDPGVTTRTKSRGFEPIEKSARASLAIVSRAQVSSRESRHASLVMTVASFMAVVSFMAVASLCSEAEPLGTNLSARTAWHAPRHGMRAALVEPPDGTQAARFPHVRLGGRMIAPPAPSRDARDAPPAAR